MAGGREREREKGILMNRKTTRAPPSVALGAGSPGSGFFLLSANLSPAQGLRYMVAAFLVAFTIGRFSARGHDIFISTYAGHLA
jgi:hypothetical protein